MLKICTDITGDQGAYETYGTQVQAEIRDVLTSVPEAEKDGQKRILFVRAGSKYSATKAKTAENNFVCVMLNELGTYNIAENAPVLLDGLSLEEILLENPDFIFISTMGDEAAAKAYMAAYSARMPGSIWTQYGTDGTPICRRNCSSSSRTSAGAKHTAIWQACCTPGRTETIWKKEQKQKTVTFAEPKPVG